MTPETLKYSEDHEWVRVDGNKVTIGITHHAQDQLGDIVFVELPDIGRELSQGEAFGVVESVKTVSDLFAPVSGKVVETNSNLREDGESFEPEVINRSPYEDGWMVVIEMTNPSEIDGLMDAAAYNEHAANDG